MASFFRELKRRSVFKVGAAYAIVAWLLVQIVTAIEEPLYLPEWVDALVIVLLALGFPVALVLAWAYELTPEGIRPSADVTLEPPHGRVAKKGWNYVIAGLLVLIVGFAIVDRWFLERGRTLATAPPGQDTSLELPNGPSVVVLPFANISDDQAQEYFADGLTDDLITDLSKLSGLLVIARNSAFAFKHEPPSVEEVARQLGVRYVVTGSVRRDGTRVRVNAQLVDAATGGQVWAERYNREITDLFAVQDELVTRIVSSLAVQLTQSEQTQLAGDSVPEFRAYDLYLQARESFFSGDYARLPESLDLYQQSWTVDPNFARAYAGYARAAVDVWRETSSRLMTNPLARKAAEDAANEALSRDPLLADAHSVLALLSMGDGRHDEAIESAQLAVQLDPNSSDARTVLAVVLGYAGGNVLALEAASSAIRLDPRPSPYVWRYYGWALFLNRRFAEAIDVLEPVVLNYSIGESDLGDAPRAILAGAYAELGRLDDAREQVRELRQQMPFLNLAHFRTVYGRHERGEDAEYRLDSLRKAGMPEWPFDFRGDPAQRLAVGTVEELIAETTWSGTDRARDLPFIERFEDNGDVAYATATTLMSGRAYIRDGELCERFDLFYWGRDACGPLYRNPGGSPESRDEYVYVNPATLRYFSVTP